MPRSFLELHESRLFHGGDPGSTTITPGSRSNRPNEGTPHQVCTDESAMPRNLFNTLISIFKLAASSLHMHLRYITSRSTSRLAGEHALKVSHTHRNALSKYSH